jgi:hypothetical protein
MRSRHVLRWLCVFCVAVVFTACTRPSPLQPLLDRTPHQLVLMGNEQIAPAGAELPDAVAVLVLDEEGKPLASQIVSFRVTGGGGEVFAGHAMTSEQGFAREWWTLGPQPGVNTLEASVLDGLSGNSIVVAQFKAVGL